MSMMSLSRLSLYLGEDHGPCTLCEPVNEVLGGTVDAATCRKLGRITKEHVGHC